MVFTLLIRCLVIGSHATGFAVHQPILTDAYIQLRLAKAAELFALALMLGFLALHAAEFGRAGSVVHAIKGIFRRASMKRAHSNWKASRKTAQIAVPNS
jgi:hypothetical protein